MAADGKTHTFPGAGHDPAPTVSLDSLTQDGDYTPVQKDQMDLASMVDCAFSMADWSTNQHGATPSVSYASPRSMQGSSPSTGLDAVDSTAADLRALDSMYTALSSLGFQDHSFMLNQVDSSVGSVHASPHGVHGSPVSTNHDDMHSVHMQSPLSCQVNRDCGDDMGGMCPPRSPHAGPGQAEEMNNKSMAAAHSALIEMQNQGLTYQNIEELVQNIQNLLNCLREKQNVQNAMNKVHMDERLRQVVLQMVQSGNPQAAQEACMLSALAAGGQFPGIPPPSGTSPNDPQQTPGATFQPPYSPMGVNASPHPLTPDTKPLANMQTPAMHDGRGSSIPSVPSLGTPRHSRPSDDHLYSFASPNVSSHGRSLQPDLSPPPAPHMSFHTPSLTPRGGAHQSPRPIQTIHTPSPHTPAPHTPRNSHTPRVASGHSGSRTRGLNLPTPQTPTTPRDFHADAHAERLPTTPTQRAFKATSLQGALAFDTKASSEPLPAPGSVRGGTGVFIPGLHRQPVGVLTSSMGGPGGGNASMNMGPGLSAPLSGGGRSGKNGAPLSAPLSDIQYAGAYDSEQQISPDSLSASAELSRVRSAAFADARGLDKLDRGERGPNPMMPMHAPTDDGYSGSLSIMNPPAYSGPIDPPAYSGSFITQELPDEEESRDLSGSGPFRHMTCHSYAGGEVMRTLFSNDTTRRPLDPTPGDAPSPASRGHRLLAGMRQGTSAPIMESPSPEADDRCASISASLSPNSGSTDNFHLMSTPHISNPNPRKSSPQESLADALGHLSIPGDSSSDKSRLQSAAQTTPKNAIVSGTIPNAVGAGSVSQSPCTPVPTSGPSPPLYRRTISDRGSRAPGPGVLSSPAMPRPVTLNNNPATQHHSPVTPQARAPSTSSLYPPPSALTPSRFDRLMPAGECVPLNVTHWSQDHSSVTIFLQLERFNPASLMVQIQQHMVVVMALNSDGPSHVFMMRPEHAVRVQGSKSRPQPGNGIQIVLQKRSPGNVWSTYGIVSTPQS